MSESDPKIDQPPLGSRLPDHAAATARALVSWVPFVGGALAEIVTQIVPNQRIDRLEKYLVFLQEEIANQKVSEDRLKQPENVDLIEDGAYLAVRALSDQRKRYIARCVAEGIALAEIEHIREKRILSLLDQLDDEEILILDAYGAIPGDEAREKFEKLRPPAPIMSAPREIHEQNSLYQASLDKLESLSLIRQRITFNRDAEKNLA
jgi:hypothetical protein